MTKIATCCFLALAAANAVLDWTGSAPQAVAIDERAGR
jgi:hypothetical protein